MKRSAWSQTFAALVALLAALPGCETVPQCPPSFLDEKPGCTQIPACSRNRVFVFLIEAVDPFSGMMKLRERLIEHGFIKVYCGNRLHGTHFAEEIARLRQDDEEARFAVVCEGSAHATARKVADEAGVPIDVMVFLDATGEGPAHARRTVLICGEDECAEDDKVALATVRLADAGRHGVTKHPETAASISRELCALAGTIPVAEQGPKCELAGCPPCGGGWDFLRPDGRDSGCVGCKPMALAAEAIATPPEAKPLPKAAPVAAKPKPGANEPLRLPPPPTRD